jgi:hypothetical protein
LSLKEGTVNNHISTQEGGAIVAAPKIVPRIKYFEIKKKKGNTQNINAPKILGLFLRASKGIHNEQSCNL